MFGIRPFVILHLFYGCKTKQNMVLSKQAIKKIKDREIVLALALALDFTELWINKCIAANKENGPLTTAKAISVIQEKTGMEVSEILVEEVQKVA